MKITPIDADMRKPEKGLVRRRKLWKMIFALICLSFFLEVLGISLTKHCLASTQDGSPISRRDKAFGVYFFNEKSGWIVGDNGLALKTQDGGGSWAGVAISDETFNDIFFIEDKGWIVGGGGLILHTEDGGDKWTKQLSNVSTSLMKVLFLNKEEGIVVGADGTILRTANGGLSWEDGSLDWMEIMPEDLLVRGVITINLYDIVFTSETTGWIAGDWGTILRTADGGVTWRIVNIGAFPPLFSIAFKGPMDGWAVGQNGFCLKTGDGGQIWEKVTLGTKESLYRIQVVNDYGVIVGDRATLLKTKDGGKTWSKISHDLRPPYPWFADVWILPSNSIKVLSVGKGIILNTQIH